MPVNGSRVGEGLESKDDLIDLRNRAKRCIIFFTIMYLLFFPFLFYVAMFSPMVFDNPDITPIMGMFFIFSIFCIPLSIPASLYFMWSFFSRAQYQRARFFCAIPLFIFAFVLVVNTVFQKIFLS